MDRRDFFRKWSGLAAVFVAGMAGCARKETALPIHQQQGRNEPPLGNQPQPATAPGGENTSPQPGTTQNPTKSAKPPQSPAPKPQAFPDLAAIQGDSPRALVETALDSLGGIKRFVRPGSKVVIKPNIAWYRTPEQAANTNPEVVETVVRLCREAGAKSVTVLDHTLDPWQACFQASGIQKAVENAGGRIYCPSREDMYTEVPVPQGKAISKELVVTDVLQADVFINLPIAKVHNAAGACVGLKNLMGVIWNRGAYHMNTRGGLSQCIADLSTVVKPHLIVADCYRVLLTNGPKGPGKIGDARTIVAGTDPVAVDSFCLRFLNLTPDDVPHIKLAHRAGLGEISIPRLRVHTASI